MTDEKLIQGLRHGRRDALHRAINRYSGYVAAVARNVLGEQATREDLVACCLNCPQMTARSLCDSTITDRACTKSRR